MKTIHFLAICLFSITVSEAATIKFDGQPLDQNNYNQTREFRDYVDSLKDGGVLHRACYEKSDDEFIDSVLDELNNFATEGMKFDYLGDEAEYVSFDYWDEQNEWSALPEEAYLTLYNCNAQ